MAAATRSPRQAHGLAPLSAVQKHTRAHTRHNNLRLVLQLIYREAPTSRAQLARASGLTPATASALVDELIERGVIVELGPGVSSGGKPPTLIGPAPSGRNIIALDLSSRPFQGAVLDLQGSILTRRVADEEDVVEERAVESARGLIDTLRAEAEAPVLGIGIGTPGVVTPVTGGVISANLGWNGLPLAGRLATDATPVHVVNDAQAAVLAEYAERGPEISSLVVVRVGDGVGAGVVLDGNLYRGDIAAAGEIGHLRVVEDGLPCRCGNSGCLETVASIPAIFGSSGLEALARRSAADDGLALAAHHLGAVLANVVGILAVRHIVLSGPIEAAGEPYLRRVGETLRSRVLPLEAPLVELSFSELGADIVLLGAAGLVVSEELGVVW